MALNEKLMSLVNNHQGERSSAGKKPVGSVVITESHFEKDVPKSPTAHVYQENDDFCLAFKRVDLPNFNGHDPVGWVYRAKQYFEVHNNRPEHKVGWLSSLWKE